LERPGGLSPASRKSEFSGSLGQIRERDVSDIPAFVRFYVGFNETGIGKDGLPVFEEVVRIKKSKPPLLEVDYVATEADFEECEEAYKMFQKEQRGRKADMQGYPLAMWPVPSPSELKECFMHDIYTVEQLAKLGKSNKYPAAILELAKRAQRMVELSSKQGKYEAIISELEGQIAAVKADNVELRTLNDSMRMKLDILANRGIAA